MNYYPMHIGDYASHTAHLSCLEDLAYRRLIDLYYTMEKPLPESVTECARKIRMREHESDVKTVLEEFFVLTREGWTNRRCEYEIEKASAKREKARDSAQRRWGGRRESNRAEPCEGNAEQSESQCIVEDSGDANALQTQYDIQCLGNATPEDPQHLFDANAIPMQYQCNAPNPNPNPNPNVPPIVPPQGGKESDANTMRISCERNANAIQTRCKNGADLTQTHSERNANPLARQRKTTPKKPVEPKTKNYRKGLEGLDVA